MLLLGANHGKQVLNELDQLGGLDLRTNLLKGGENDVIMISSKYKVMKVWFRQEET